MGIIIYCDNCAETQIDLNKEKITSPKELIPKGWDIDLDNHAYHICDQCNATVQRIANLKSNLEVDRDFLEATQNFKHVIKTPEHKKARSSIDVIDDDVKINQITPKYVYCCWEPSCAYIIPLHELDIMESHELTSHGAIAPDLSKKMYGISCLWCGFHVFPKDESDSKQRLAYYKVTKHEEEYHMQLLNEKNKSGKRPRRIRIKRLTRLISK